MRHFYTALPVLVSAFGLLIAYHAWQQFDSGDLGNALISAALALALTLMPHLNLTKEMFSEDAQKVFADAARNPLTLKIRLVIALAWILSISGFVILLLE